jgi:hypothetical protein
VNNRQTMTLGRLLNEIAELNPPTEVDNELPDFDDYEPTVVACQGIAPCNDDSCELAVADNPDDPQLMTIANWGQS